MFIKRLAFGCAIGVLALGGVAFAAPSDQEHQPSFELAKSLIDAEQFEKAVAVLKKLDADNVTSEAQVDLLFGRIYLAINKPAKSLEYFEHALLSSLDVEAEAYLGMAEAKLTLGDLGQARKNAVMAIRTDPDLIEAHLVIAMTDQRIGRADQALSRLRQLQKNQPSSEDVAVILARYLAHQNGPDAGVTELQRFIEEFPSSPGAWDVYGQMLWASGKKAEGVDARLMAQRMYSERGQSGRAEAMATWLKSVDPKGVLQSRAAKVEERQKEPPKEQPKEPPPPKIEEQPKDTAPVLRHPTEATRRPPTGTDEPPPPSAVPRPVVKAVPIATALPHPEPLPFAPGSPVMTGSGVVLEGGRLVITNRHVIEGMGTIAVRNGTGHVRSARIVKVSDDDDLALLEIDKPFPEGSVMAFSAIVEPVAGRSAIVMGYPIINLFGDEQPSLTEGIVSKAAGLGDDVNTFQLTAKLNKGNSGGPIFDKRGHLIGVAVGKVDTAKIYQKSGMLLEDINLGIKGDRILHFLGKPPAAVDAPPEMNLEDLYQQMLPRAVLIAAQK